MEVESAARRMWGYLRAVFFMVRKGVISKRRLLLGMQLAMRLKRRNRALLAPGDECSTPGLSPLLGTTGGYSVRVSNYSSEEEEDGDYGHADGGGGEEAVDDEAEEFIRRFYEQLRRQNHVALLPYMTESAA
uniref:Uncharacterized protein n=1 Tax=Oryza barthii TaxID=65489 RepID=A0A0D3EY80_9ORYZ